ncbi:hypothetical protein Bca52824_005061 [Brassica carinata]|uniref:Uncharacterized protein n=1 Tax=Brassica carinata TaxID=52824 RepID=A0A8X7WQ61_BRACI|nr:hypothetical protein Bca52824_005061 [Brassica carinata]
MKGFTDRVRIDVALILLPRSLSISPRSRHHSHPPSPTTFSLRRSIFVVVSLVTFTTTVEDTATADLGGSLVVLVSQKVCAGVYKDVTTTQLDELAAETAAAMTANHPDYTSLAARIDVSNLHKNTKKSFSETIKDMYNHVNERSGLESPLIADDVFEIIIKNAYSSCQ